MHPVAQALSVLRTFISLWMNVNTIFFLQTTFKNVLMVDLCPLNWLTTTWYSPVQLASLFWTMAVHSWIGIGAHTFKSWGLKTPSINPHRLINGSARHPETASSFAVWKSFSQQQHTSNKYGDFGSAVTTKSSPLKTQCCSIPPRAYGTLICWALTQLKVLPT